MAKNFFLRQIFKNISKITIVNGGKERIDSIHNIIKAIDIEKINDLILLAEIPECNFEGKKLF